MALVFLVGVVVGKSLWGDAPRGAERILGDVAQTQAAPATDPSAKAKERPMYTFYDDVKKPEGTTAPPKAKAAPVEEPSPTAVVPRVDKAVTPVVAEPAPPKAAQS